MKEVIGYNPSKDPRLIDCKTECGNDKCYARRYGLFAEKTCPNFVEPKPQTNADKIRAMSDEELAEWLADHPVVSMYDGSNPQHKAWLDWLKQKAGE